MGWLQKAELAARSEQEPESGKICKACHGSKALPCPVCMAKRTKQDRLIGKAKRARKASAVELQVHQLK
jgi:hypothetical protein